MCSDTETDSPVEDTPAMPEVLDALAFEEAANDVFRKMRRQLLDIQFMCCALTALDPEGMQYIRTGRHDDSDHDKVDAESALLYLNSALVIMAGRLDAVSEIGDDLDSLFTKQCVGRGRALQEAARETQRMRSEKHYNTDVPLWDDLRMVNVMIRGAFKHRPQIDDPSVSEILADADQLAERIDKLIKKPEAVTEGQDHA